MIRYISAHEVGHCLGLQHNMAASSIRSLKDINTEGYVGPTIGSVMDYVAANINHGLGDVQGAYASPELGPYDKWVIAYGYGPEDQLDAVRREGLPPRAVVWTALGRVASPVLLCALTTVAGFLSLCTSSLPAIREFGLFCSIGTLGCMAAALWRVIESCGRNVPSP